MLYNIYYYFYNLFGYKLALKDTEENLDDNSIKTDANKITDKISNNIDTIIKNEPFKLTKYLIKNPTNFYYLSLIKEDDNESWSIHGLWPQYTLDKYPQFCKDSTFDMRKLNPIIDQLKKYWYSNRETDSAFWEHEYLKHGTCNFNNFSELDYFKTTLNLYFKAIEKNLPDIYYDKTTNKCLIPVTKDLVFFTIDN